MDEAKTILRTLVGSRAYGLAREDSDWDFRSVYITPTEKILAIYADRGNNLPKAQTGEDVEQWEVERFLRLSLKSNPSVLEIYWAIPQQVDCPWGEELRSLRNQVWSSKGVLAAFLGYASSQKNQTLKHENKRASKHAQAYLRVLYQGAMLLKTGELPIYMGGTPIYDTMMGIRTGDIAPEQALRICECWEARIRMEYEERPDRLPDLEAINRFLIRVRREHFSIELDKGGKG